MTYGPDAPKGEKRRQPAYLMMRALKRYYAKLTTAKLRNMENPPGFVQQWLEQATLMGTNLQADYAESALVLARPWRRLRPECGHCPKHSAGHNWLNAP